MVIKMAKCKECGTKYKGGKFCPECGAKKRSRLTYVGLGILGLALLLFIGALASSGPVDTNTTQKVVEPKVFENDFIKFTIPDGTTVNASQSGVLEFNDPKLNTEFEGKSVPYGDVIFDGDDIKESPEPYIHNLLMEGYTLKSKKVSGYEVYSKKFDAITDYYDIQVIIPSGSGTKIVWFTFDVGSEKQMNIILDSLVIK